MDPPEWKHILENEMVVELSKHLNPRLEERWADFDCRLNTHLSPARRAGLTNVYKAFEALKNKEVIKTGEYEALRRMVNPIHVEMGVIIDKYTAKMQARDAETDTIESLQLQGRVMNDMEASDKMKDLENKMAVKLGKHLHPRLKSDCANFD